MPETKERSADVDDKRTLAHWIKQRSSRDTSASLEDDAKVSIMTTSRR